MKLLLIGILFIVLLPVLLLSAALVANRLPWTDPPGFGPRLRTYLSRNVVEPDPGSEFPERRPRAYAVAPDRLFDAALAACRRLAWNVAAAEPETGTIHAVVVTPLWRFKDDVHIQVQTADDGTGILLLRSSSRVGKGDLGANTRHVLDLVEAVDGALGEVD